jgi:peptide deformylase
MRILPIYLYGADVLRKKARPVREFDDALIELIQNMFETMRSGNGIGLAANQVGVLERVIVVDISDVEEGKGTKPVVLINPEVISQTGECSMEEGCLSIPGVRDVVLRAEKITVRFKDGSFNDVTLEATGLLGRVILHEIDHLNGVLFTDYFSPVRRRAQRPQLDAIRKGEIEVSYPVVLPETVPK